jgi:hypothetical protein
LLGFFDRSEIRRNGRMLGRRGGYADVYELVAFDLKEEDLSTRQLSPEYLQPTL